ncbi:conjugal transfer protein TraN, partial [Enterobacter hormaechei]
PAGSYQSTGCVSGKQDVCRKHIREQIADFQSGASGFTLVLVMNAVETTFVPEVNWSSSCGLDMSKAQKTTSTCTSPGGNKTIVNNGQSYNVYSDCWQYTDNYVVPSDSTGTCGTLMTNPSCTAAGNTCTESTDGQCTHMSYTYQCQTTHQSGGLVCGGDYICKSGECDDTNGAGSSGFDTAVAKLAGLASAAEDAKDASSTIEVKAFTGKAMRCRKAFAGFSNCCKDSGWGQSAGLAACDDEEKAIGKAKAKKITVSVGERCDRQVLGACIQKSQVYCVFDGKLARIIQEQGRRDQLGVKFGSGDSPNCRGITVPELQRIDFDKINFSDFYEDLMKNQKIPDTSAQVQQIKERIAAQVNQQGGGK